jgi:hypothetical protein
LATKPAVCPFNFASCRPEMKLIGINWSALVELYEFALGESILARKSNDPG